MRQVQPSSTRVVEVLTREGDIWFEGEGERQVAVHATRGERASLYGSGDQHAFRAGQRLTTEHVIDDHYCRAEFVVERAVHEAGRPARVQLLAVRVTGVRLPELPRRRRPNLRLVA
jgi:hypothetical protein